MYIIQNPASSPTTHDFLPHDDRTFHTFTAFAAVRRAHPHIADARTATGRLTEEIKIGPQMIGMNHD
jgi:hypothetical protein